MMAGYQQFLVSKLVLCKKDKTEEVGAGMDLDMKDDKFGLCTMKPGFSMVDQITVWMESSVS